MKSILIATAKARLTIEDPAAVPAWARSLPGVNELAHGTMAKGYFGQVPHEELINTAGITELAGLVGQGSAIGGTMPWLKYAYNNKVLYVPRRPMRRGITWTRLNTSGVVYGKDVVIQGRACQIRLLKGGDDDPATVGGREWNDLIYPICAIRPAGSEIWDNISETDLNVRGSGGVGSANWCQEAEITAPTTHIFRGSTGLTAFGHNNSGSDYNNYGWRPVVEFSN